jgi:hypothetical protein
MKLALAVAAVLAVGCVDERPETLGDFAEVWAGAAEANAIECGKVRAESVGNRIMELVCNDQDCHAAPRCDVAIEECVREQIAMECTDQDFPSACLDMLSGFACLYGESDHGRS